jgi:hypothetical protein
VSRAGDLFVVLATACHLRTRRQSLAADYVWSAARVGQFVNEVVQPTRLEGKSDRDLNWTPLDVHLHPTFDLNVDRLTDNDRFCILLIVSQLALRSPFSLAPLALSPFHYRPTTVDSTPVPSLTPTLTFTHLTPLLPLSSCSPRFDPLQCSGLVQTPLSGRQNECKLKRFVCRLLTFHILDSRFANRPKNSFTNASLIFHAKYCTI